MATETTTSAKPPVWLITGCSTGFGHELAKQALARGFRVAATAREPDELKSLMSLGDALTFRLDVTDHRQIESAVKAAEDKFGQIDVLVNNAGIGYFAAIEEGEIDQIRRLFEINVFGLSRMIQTVLPGMRRKRSGLIVNLSSIGGICGMPALGYYNATKFAVEGLSEALRGEVTPLGLKVMVVEPSGFRTDWAGRSAEEVPGRFPITPPRRTRGARGCGTYRASSQETRFAPQKRSSTPPCCPNRPIICSLARTPMKWR